MGKMLAVKLFGVNDVRLVDCEVPQIEEGEVLVKTSVAAVCGTDIRMIRNGYEGISEERPLTLGHEVSGVIERSKTKNDFYYPGRRVTIAPNIGCGVCEMCKKGDTHLCKDYRALGIQIEGCMAEYVRIPVAAVEQGNVIPIPKGVTMEEAAVFEPMACVMNGQDRAEVTWGDRVLVIGAGPIGVMHALMARARGAEEIYVNDISNERLEQCVKKYPFIRALQCGDLKEGVSEATKGAGVDVCITACPVKEIQEQTLDLMAVNGRILFFGGLPADRDFISLHSNEIHYKQLKISGSTRCNAQHLRRVGEMVRRKDLDLAGIVTDMFSVEEYQKAIGHVMAAKGLKTAIKF